MLTRDEMKKIIDAALSYSKADACGVSVGQRNRAQMRFARNSVTTSGSHNSVTVTVSSVKGDRTGTTAINEYTPEALAAAVKKSEELASFAPPNPEFVKPLPPQKYPQTNPYDEPTAKSAQAEMFPAISSAIKGSNDKKLLAAGYYERIAADLAFGTSTGNFGASPATLATYSLTVRTPDGTGSGWGGTISRRMSDIDGATISKAAIDKAVLSQRPHPLEPGEYTVILEPAAAAGLVNLLFNGFSARDAEEGTSLLTKKGGGTLLGEKLFSEKFSARTDPFDSRSPGMPWLGEVATEIPNIGSAFFTGMGGPSIVGDFLPTRKTTWIEKGVVKSLGYDRYWALKKDVEPTPNPGTDLIIDGEDHSIDDLVKSTDRGLLITRFWYIRYVNRQTLQLTGLTRDGVFMIEKGKISHPVTNFRWNESPARAMRNVEMLSRPAAVENYNGVDIVPGMKITNFPVSSLSEAV